MRHRRFPKNSACYACSTLATDKEHVPARCFFPSGRRCNLLTVPSCSEHNGDLSKDVEYVRNMIVFLENLNPAGKEMFETAKRSFEGSDGLFFRSLGETRFLGDGRCILKFDLERVNRVMDGVARAVYFNQNGSRCAGEWNILTILHTEASITGKSDEWQVHRPILDGFGYEDLEFPEPEVFRCEQAKVREQTVYRFTFYEGFSAFAWTGPTDPTQLVKESGQSHRLLLVS